MRRSPGLRGSARRSSFISGASKCKPGTKRTAVVRVQKIKSLAFHLPCSRQLSIGAELTDGQELVENSGSFGGGRKRDRTSDLGLVRAALPQLSYPPTFAASASCTRKVTVDDTRRVPKGARELASDVLEVTGAGAPEVVPMHPRGRRPPCGCCPCLSVTLLLRAIGAWTNSATPCRRLAAVSRT